MKFITSADSPSIAKTETVAAAAVIFLVSLLAMRPSIRGHDGFGHYAWIMSLAVDGDLDFANQYAAWDLRTGGVFAMGGAPVSPATGLPGNRYGIGTALFQAPAVLLVHLVLRGRAPELATGLTSPYEWAVCVSTAFWTGVGLWLLFLHLRRRHDVFVSVAAVTGIVLATPLCFYAWLHGSMSHGVSFFVSVLLVLFMDQAVSAPTLRGAASLGAACALVLMTRIQDAVWGGAVCIFFIVALRRSAFPARRAVALCAMLTAGAAITFLPQLAAWKHLYGSWLSGPSPYTDGTAGSFGFTPLNIPLVLFSERGGFLAWHPILIAALVGLAMIRSGERSDLARGTLAETGLAGVALQVVLISCWSMWWAGASFGNRFFISAYPVLCVGLATGIEQARGRFGTAAVTAALAFLIAWNAGLLVQYGTEMIPREEAVPWMEVIGNQFTRVPGRVIGFLGGRPG